MMHVVVSMLLLMHVIIVVVDDEKKDRLVIIIIRNDDLLGVVESIESDESENGPSVSTKDLFPCHSIFFSFFVFLLFLVCFSRGREKQQQQQQQPTLLSDQKLLLFPIVTLYINIFYKVLLLELLPVPLFSLLHQIKYIYIYIYIYIY